MTTFRLTLPETIADKELVLAQLQAYLKDAGYFVDLEVIPPTDEELGGKTVALILIAGIAVEQLQESLHLWEVQHSKPHIEIVEPKPPIPIKPLYSERP